MKVLQWIWKRVTRSYTDLPYDERPYNYRRLPPPVFMDLLKVLVLGGIIAGIVIAFAR